MKPMETFKPSQIIYGCENVGMISFYKQEKIIIMQNKMSVATIKRF